MAAEKPPPYDYPPCADCSHPFGAHRAVGKGAVKHRGPCSSGLGPKGTPCGCRAYRVGAA